MNLIIDNGIIYCELSESIQNTKKPILFVLPGGPGSDHSIYKFHSRELEDFYCVVYHDPRGCGKSNIPDSSTATMENYINDIELLRKHLKIDKFSILGTSYGSMCAIGYATQYSHNLQKLILVTGSPSYHFLDTAKKNLEARGTSEQKEISQALWEGNFKNNEHVADFMRIMKSMYSRNSNYINSSNSNNYNFSVDILNLGFKSFMRTFNFETQLTKILCPTLILVGKEDWINDPVHLQQTANIIPNAQYELIENCGHLVAIDQHEIYLKFIRQFLLE